MLSEIAAGEIPLTRAQAFWWRIGDNFFRRIVLYALPVLAFAALGAIQAGKTLELYRSNGTLSAKSNPLVPNPTGAANTPQLYETAAGALARSINERLRTDDFLAQVAAAAGLDAALDSGEVRYGDIRASVWASEKGTSILDISATWTDPETSYLLAAATIDTYSAYLFDTVGSDAEEAVRYYSGRVERLQVDREAVEAEYDAYVSTLPELSQGEEHGFDVQVQLGRLQSRLDAINGAIASAEESLEDAELTLFQLDAEVGSNFHVVDPPEPASKPESNRADKLATFGSFTMLGVAVSAAILLATTMIDRSVNSPVELLSLPGVDLVATVNSRRRFAQRHTGGRR